MTSQDQHREEGRAGRTHRRVAAEAREGLGLRDEGVDAKARELEMKSPLV